jgi:hypothetical protein
VKENLFQWLIRLLCKLGAGGGGRRLSVVLGGLFTIILLLRKGERADTGIS